MARKLCETLDFRDSDGQWLPCAQVTFPVPTGRCSLYVWPFGSIVFHVIEDLTMPNLAALAVWRIQSYEQNLAWATAELCALLPEAEPAASYVLSAYWMQRPAWAGEQLDTALRILCIPKILLERELDTNATLYRASLVEHALLGQGFTHPGLRSFGVKGASVGYASWSGVVYYPLAEQRCLSENELISAELAAQALWVYCTYINSEAEQGRDPVVSTEYGWRFLRGMRSLLANPRPQEIEQHREMRNALLETSGLDTLLTNATDILREIERDR